MDRKIVNPVTERGNNSYAHDAVPSNVAMPGKSMDCGPKKENSPMRTNDLKSYRQYDND